MHLTWTNLLLTMLKNYFKIGWRNLLRNKTYSLINICGLAMGMAVAMLIGLWMFDELSFNTSFKNYARLGSVYHHVAFGADVFTIGDTPMPLGAELKNSHGEFENVAMATWPKEVTLNYEGTVLTKTGMYVEPAFLEMFSIPMVQGIASLQDIHSILLSETLARDFFAGDAVGKVLKFDNREDFIVAGVFKDFPANSDFAGIKLLAPISYHFSKGESTRKQMTNWEDLNFQCFVLLHPRVSFAAAEQKVKTVLHEHGSGDMKALKPEGILLPMERWHLYSEYKDGKPTAGKVKFVWMFGVVGVFVLLLACINFMNLSTARSEKRSKEVGIRKVMGSMRAQLVGQFLSESLLLVVIAFAMAILTVVLCLPWFNGLVDKQISIPWGNGYFVMASAGFILLTSVLAGSYPALFLSGFNPVKVLKGALKTGPAAAIPRKAMVVFQFTASISLIIATIVVYQQIQHAKDRPVGFDRKGIFYVSVRTLDLGMTNYNTLREDMLATGLVENMAKSDFPITGAMSGEASLSWEGKDPANKPLIAMNSVSHDFPSTNGFQFVAGRDFSRDFVTDSMAVVINELAARLISDKKDVIGKKIKFGSGKEREIIGVIKDQIRWTPFTKQSPHLYLIKYEELGYLTIRLKPEAGVHEGVAAAEAVLRKHAPGAPFNYKFIDDDYARLFSNEERVGKLATVFAGLTIFISCIGIFGLAAFAASQRTKEIGIRKVLGASVFRVWQMLSRDFAWLVVVAIILSTPLAWVVTNQWLAQYDYRIEVSWWVFAVTGLAALLITLLTISYQSIKAALANPVDSLRSE